MIDIGVREDNRVIKSQSSGHHRKVIIKKTFQKKGKNKRTITKVMLNNAHR